MAGEIETILKLAGARNNGGSGAAQLDRLLAKSATAPRVPSTRFLQRTAADMASGVLLLPEQHTFRWIGLDPGSLGYVNLYFDRSFTAGSERVALLPGTWIPIAGRAVYGVWLPFNDDGYQVGTAANNLPFGDAGAVDDLYRVGFIVTEESAPPTMQIPLGRQPIAANSVVPGVATAPTTDPDIAGALIIPPGYDMATVIFHDNSSAPLVNLEVSTQELWWYSSDAGYWFHNDADDWDAAGRGGVDGTAGAVHSFEVYEIPQNVSRMYFNKISGSVHWADVIFSRPIKG